MQKVNFSIKELRRAEESIDDEIQYSTRKIYSSDSYSSSDESISETTKKITSTIGKLDELLSVKYYIRKVNSDFKESKGINERTINIAKLENHKKFLEDVLSRLSSPSNTSWGEAKPKWTSGLSIETTDKYRSELRSIDRKIQKLKDSCNGINSSSSIEIDKDIIDVLVKYNFVDA